MALKLRPIRISVGALGKGLPKQDLVLSPWHRVLVRSKIAYRICGENETLVPVKKLLGLEVIDVVEAQEDVTYYHLLFDRHEVIFANDAPTESLFLGPQSLKSLSQDMLEELTTLFPAILRTIGSTLFAKKAKRLPFGSVDTELTIEPC